jgi:hypothetical protein
MLAFAALYSIAVFAVPAFFAAEGFEAVTGTSLDSIDGGYVLVLLSAERHVGAFAIAATASGFFFLFGAFRKGERWSWWALLILGLVSWGWGLVDNLLMGSTLNAILHAVGTVVFLVGLLLPIGMFFGKKG